MKKVYIKTTESCQLRCKHCYIGDNRKVHALFDEEKTIDWLKEWLKIFGINESDMLISFHGGEPFLCSTNKMQKVVNSFPSALFDATSNLSFALTDNILKFISDNFFDPTIGEPFIKTSWDHAIRFPNDKTLSIWENNVIKLIAAGVRVKVIICLTSPLIAEIKPADLISYFNTLGVKEIDFERLTENTTIDKTLIPNYVEQDEWLLAFYEQCNGMTVGMFENLKQACEGNFIGCRKRQCMQEVITINANGTVGGCPNTAIYEYHSHINEAPKPAKQNCQRDKLIDKEGLRQPQCYICELHDICNGDCHQLSWQGGKCPAPQKLIRRIKHDLER